ncbi:PREDICTED: leucine-rich repeat-containing protein 34-like [Amphimedon queenslandica]|uniref:Leucine-rich repeat-containing protein 34 n=1 Tax=Amphimedon queenslandica TaxID=400682 RepID=A0A1X7URB1_AMPQE|nr:PREDICTED: leucine-rich repeat-containing protein 34-like [Amphimedon queenslandica]|eukprot:XP_011404247.1 PREDICTED: leucine-rich repeat-containing protein 34-like [Amphimedon queenslandica]
MSLLKSWEEAARIECGYSSSPNYEAIRSIVATENQSEANSSLHLNGNQASLREKRLNDQDVEVLSHCLIDGSVILLSLVLSYNRITDKGVEHIAQYIKEVKCPLQHLDLSYNDISVDGIALIADALQFNTSLQHVSLDGNLLEKKGGLDLAAMLQVNTTLTHLTLSNTHLHTDCIIAMATVLHGNQTIQCLDLSRPLVHSCLEESTIHISKMLKISCTLKEIHLSKHDMTDTGVKWMATCLMENPNSSLTHLDLSCNKLSRDGASHIAEFLLTNPPLEVLNLSCNRIESEGLISLSNALQSGNNRLKSLLVISNDIHDAGLLAVANLMQVNSVLSQLHIWGNKWTTPTCDAFRELLKTGRLQPGDIDVNFYEVDGVTLLARTLQEAL